MAIYTRTGDKGYTSLYDGSRVSKADPVFSVLGDLDELNSWVGFLISTVDFSLEAKEFLTKIQSDLFILGSCLANPKTSFASSEIFAQRVNELEKLIDEITSSLPELKNFILPGGSKGSSMCHVCRSICRRVERRYVELILKKKTGTEAGGFENLDGLQYALPVFQDAQKFLNRLSDFLFSLARVLNSSERIDDVIWKSNILN